MKKNKTYMDKLMQDKEFRENFDEEYKNLCLAEQIAKARFEKKIKKGMYMTIASEFSLVRDWLKPEEDEAWQNL